MIVEDLEKILEEEVDYEDEDIENADDDEEAVDIAEYRITSFGIDYDVDGIVRRLERQTIVLPDFQRAYVWSIRRASKFIESLLLKLPIPGIFLYREHGSHKQMVIDGQQRLETLRRFYDGKFGNRDFALTGVREPFEGLMCRSLTDEQKGNLDETIIHATIVKQDEPNDGGSSQLEIFQRLNANATPLSAQEIRAASFRGPFCDLLVELNDNENWRELFGRKHRRRRDEELILRFFTLYFCSDKYQRPMRGFMNDFMKSNQGLKKSSERAIGTTFCGYHQHNIRQDRAPKAFKPTRSINASLFDSLMVGIGRRLEAGSIESDIHERYDHLLKDDRVQNGDWLQNVRSQSGSHSHSTCDRSICRSGVDKCMEVIVEQEDKLRRLFSHARGHATKLDALDDEAKSGFVSYLCIRIHLGILSGPSKRFLRSHVRSNMRDTQTFNYVNSQLRNLRLRRDSIN